MPHRLLLQKSPSRHPVPVPTQQVCPEAPHAAPPPPLPPVPPLLPPTPPPDPPPSPPPTPATQRSWEQICWGRHVRHLAAALPQALKVCFEAPMQAFSSVQQPEQLLAWHLGVAAGPHPAKRTTPASNAQSKPRCEAGIMDGIVSRIYRDRAMNQVSAGASRSGS